MAAYPAKPKNPKLRVGGLGIRAAWAFGEGVNGDGPANTRDAASGAIATKISTSFPGWAKTEIGPALNFFGTDVIGPDRMPPGSVFSVFALVKQTSNAGNQVLYENSSIIWYLSSGVPRWFDAADNAIAPTAIPLNVWVTLGFTSDGKNLTNWVNGVAVASAAKASQLPTGTVAIGGNTSGGQPFSGLMAGLYVATQCWGQGMIERLQSDFWFPLREPSIVDLAGAFVKSAATNGLLMRRRRFAA